MHCKASTQLFCKTETCVSDSEIVAKSKLNLTCEVYISSNVMNRDRWDKSRWIKNRQYMTNDRQQDSNEMIDDKTVKQQKTSNEIWQIIRYSKFWRWYDMTNTIDDEIRTVTKW